MQREKPPPNIYRRLRPEPDCRSASRYSNRTRMKIEGPASGLFPPLAPLDIILSYRRYSKTQPIFLPTPGNPTLLSLLSI